ncbi:MAG: ArsR/SmtB family transcription factor [Streptosporangiaceae bacterium]
MVRVNFTADDLARTRFSTAPAPMMETELAWLELRRAGIARRRARIRPWQREARRALPAAARPLLDLLGPHPPWPTFIDSPAADFDEALDFVRATPRSQLRQDMADSWACRPGRPPGWLRNLADGDAEALEVVVCALRAFHDAVITPRWNSVVSSYHADIAQRMPVLAAGGHEALFGTLHEELRWRDDGLDRRGLDWEWKLDGNGILLMPSAFWSGTPLFVMGDGVRLGNALIYPAQPNGQPADPGEGGAADTRNDRLAALLGPTRAAVLRALAEPRGTAGLAHTVGISQASASEHAKVLRDAYLIETRREGRSVRHSLTPLGNAMLGQLRLTTEEPGDRAG